MRFRHTVPCSRPTVAAFADAFGNTLGVSRDEVEFHAAFMPPTTVTGSQIVDGQLRQTTVTKSTLMVEYTADNADVFTDGAIVSGDLIVVDGDTGWQVDGEPAKWVNAQSGKRHPMVIELRRMDG